MPAMTWPEDSLKKYDYIQTLICVIPPTPDFTTLRLYKCMKMNKLHSRYKTKSISKFSVFDINFTWAVRMTANTILKCFKPLI